VYHEGERGRIGPTTISRPFFDNSIFAQESLVASAAPDRKHGAAQKKLQNKPDIALFLRLKKWREISCIAKRTQENSLTALFAIRNSKRFSQNPPT
jgi:hypothetical protein